MHLQSFMNTLAYFQIFTRCAKITYEKPTHSHCVPTEFTKSVASVQKKIANNCEECHNKTVS